MKKLALSMVAVLLSVMMSMTAFAATVDEDVYIDLKKNTVNGTELVVTIETNGSTTDGLLTVNYDSSVVSCTEDSVVFGDGVDMYSANVVEDGVLKIAYLAGEAIPKGEFIDVNFTFKSSDTAADKAGIKLSGEAFDANGGELEVGEIKPSEPSDGNNNNNNGGNQSGDNNQDNTGNSGSNENAGSPNTGDDTSVMPIAVVLIVCVLACGVVVVRRKKITK